MLLQPLLSLVAVGLSAVSADLKAVLKSAFLAEQLPATPGISLSLLKTLEQPYTHDAQIVLLTGASGRIGRPILVKFLKDPAYRVIGLANNRIGNGLVKCKLTKRARSRESSNSTSRIL
jgi:hypothetical protein